MENVKDAACHIPVVLERVKREYLVKTYKISSWTDPTDFLEQVAQRTGKLLKVVQIFVCSFYVRFYFISSFVFLEMFLIECRKTKNQSNHSDQSQQTQTIQ